MAARFAARVDISGGPDACWLWTERVNTSGYGELRDNGGRIVSAHRAAWVLAYGPIPEGMQVLHTCSERYEPGDWTSRRCLNPRHLKLGTNADNVADRVREGREPDRAGEMNGRARLSEQDVRDIRTDLAAGVPQQALADRYGVTTGAIWFIKHGRTWRHLTQEIAS